MLSFISAMYLDSIQQFSSVANWQKRTREQRSPLGGGRRVVYNGTTWYLFVFFPKKSVVCEGFTVMCRMSPLKKRPVRGKTSRFGTETQHAKR